jgi:hypothetical protein
VRGIGIWGLGSQPTEQRPGGPPLTRSGCPALPCPAAILYNHDNEYLHYQDDWYIVASKPGKYVFVYYRQAARLPGCWAAAGAWHVLGTWARPLPEPQPAADA